MPAFTKKTNTESKDALSLAEARKIFIGRTSELDFFVQEILVPEDPRYNIISISGQAGVGKSTLLIRFFDQTHGADFRDYCRVAQVDQNQTTPAAIMEKFAKQLSLTGDFEKALSQYEETLRRVQSEHEAKRPNFLRQATTDVAGSLAKTVPVFGEVLATAVEPAVGSIFEELHNQQLRKDSERLEDSIGDLTRNFVKELNKVADASVTVGLNRTRRQRRVVLFFDAYEELAAEANPWLLKYFLEEEVSPNVVLIVAGQKAIDRFIPEDLKRWLPYHDKKQIHLISLEHFTQDEARTYLAEREITDPTQVNNYWELSRGLPFALGLLTSNEQRVIDPTKDVVDNFLHGIPAQEQVKRRLALDAACFSRPFNQDDLAAFSYVPEQERSQLYLWLTGQAFVLSSSQDGRYICHELALDWFCRYLYQRSPEAYSATRRALAAYYRSLLNKKVKEESKDVYESAQWLELTLALAHQLFLLADEGSHTQAVERILDAYDHAGQAGEIVRLLRDLKQGSVHSQVSARTQRSAKQLLEYMELQNSEAEGAPQGFLAAVQYLVEQVANERSCSTELVASLYYQRGVAYERLKQYQRAIADYTQAITLNPEVAPGAAATLGLLLQLQGDLERARTFYQRALDNGDPDWAPKAAINLGLLHQEQGDFEGARTFYQRALDSGDSEAIPRLADHPLGLQQQGDLKGARAVYQRALDSGDSEAIPRAAINLGLLLQHQGDFEGARTVYQQALDSGDSEAAALELQQGDLIGTMTVYQQALESGDFEAIPRVVALRLLLQLQGILEGVNVDNIQANLMVLPPGAAKLEAFITIKGDNPAYDDAVHRLVVEAQVLALGAPAHGDVSGTAHLLHCTIPVGDKTIAMLPVFTRVAHVVSAVQMNPAWQTLQVVLMESSVVLGDLEKEEYLGINPWSGYEFKLQQIPSTNLPSTR